MRDVYVPSSAAIQYEGRSSTCHVGGKDWGGFTEAHRPPRASVARDVTLVGSLRNCPFEETFYLL